MDIAQSQYHKHGGHLVLNMDMPGFSRQDQHFLAALVRTHRRKLPPEEFELSERILRLAVLLRISVVLHRGRTSDPLPHVQLKVKEKKIPLEVPAGWLSHHPLTELDLAQESSYLKAVGYDLTTS